MPVITITDPSLLSELLRYEGTVEFQGPDGQRLGQFTAGALHKLPRGVQSPFTDEQLVELRQQRDGRPLSEILRDLKGRN